MTPTPLNYWSQARPHLARLLHKLPAVDRAMLETIILTADKAPKFILPDEGRLLERDKQVIFVEEQLNTLHLPYPEMVIEYPVTYSHGENFDPHEATRSSKRLGIVMDLKHLATRLKVPFPQGMDVGIMVVPISYYDKIDLWVPMPVAGIIDTTEEAPPDYAYSNLNVQLTPWLPSMVREGARKMGKSEQDFMHHLRHDVNSEVCAVIDMLQIMQCSNVKATKLNTVDQSVNRKRVSKGKVPLFEYHVLAVDLAGVSSVGTRPTYEPSDRKGPREHLRRGHIRQCQSGKRVFVQACVVGSKANGVSEKVYAVGF